MSDPEAISRSEGLGSVALWVGVLTGPVAWSIQLAVGYAIEDWIACAPGAASRGTIWTLTVPSWVVILNVVLLSATVAAGLVALRCLRRLRGRDVTTGGRARWMAVAGVINSVLFALIIALAFIPALTFDACVDVL